MDHLDQLESQSIYIIREAYKKFRKIGMLWSIGKDSVLGDSKIYYKINSKLKWGCIEDLYKEVTPKEVFKKGNKEFITPKEKVEVLSVNGKNQRKAKIQFNKVTTLISHFTSKDVYEIKLQTNKHIKVTRDHSLIGSYTDKNGLTLKPVEVYGLTRKDSIFCANTLNFDVKNLKKVDDIGVADWILVLGGLWLADGCYALDRKIIISTGKNKGILSFLKKIPREKPIVEKIAKELREHPNFKRKNLKLDLAKKISKKHGVSFWSAYDSKKRMEELLNRKENLNVLVKENGDVWICSKKLVTKLKKLGFKGLSKNKKIPSWIYTLSNKQLALFLGGYFAGDGSCWRKDNKFAISFSSINKNLLESIRPLLLRLGISHGFSVSNARGSGFRTKSKKMYQIIVSSKQSIKNFLKGVPDLANKLRKVKINWAGKSNYQISARKVKHIKILPKKMRKVYDLEVENTHNFIANDIICHNSTTLLWLAKKAFYGKVPFPVIYIDTGLHFKEMYEFRDMCVKKWGLNLIVSKNYEEAEQKGIGPKAKLECCTVRKTDALKKTIAEHKFEALLLGIRRDEHGIRAKERVFSPRDRDFKWDYKDQPPELWDQFKTQKEGEQHLRVHPLLHWTEIDIWDYIKRENLPVNPLYFAKKGKRYRSLGCMPCTSPVKSKADNVDKIIKEVKKSKIAERSGRAQDKEEANAMQKLRSLGYMILF